MSTEERGYLMARMRIGAFSALSAAFLAEAIRVLGRDRGWITSDGQLANGILVFIFVAGMLVFGALVLARRRIVRTMSSDERSALGDELAVFETRQGAVRAFQVTYVVAVLLAVVLVVFDATLPGASVALMIGAVANATLAVGNLESAGA